MFNIYKRLAHKIYWAIHWRLLKLYPCWVKLYLCWVRLCLEWRWYAGGEGRNHPLLGKLIVSLTSYPPRFNTLALTLRSLLRQTVAADHIILWIAHADMQYLPESVLALQKSGLEIRATDDIKSYKKIIPALVLFPDAFICTADDDIYYHATWLEELMDGVSQTNNIVTCHRAHEITLDEQGKFNPYNKWILETPRREISCNFFPTSGAGALYPPRSFFRDVTDSKIFVELCPNADDIWLYWMGRLAGVTYKTVGRKRPIINWEGSQDIALYKDNLFQGGNDKQIIKIAEKYGYPTINAVEILS